MLLLRIIYGELLMKIMLVIPAFVIGGAENMVCNLAKELKHLGVSVVIVVFYIANSCTETELQNAGIEIVSLDKHLGFDIRTITRLHELIKTYKPDIIHSHLHTLSYVWLADVRVPVVHTLHSVASREQTGIRKALCGLIYRFSKKVTPVALTDEVKESIIEEYGVNSKKIREVQNGIDLTRCIKKSSYDLVNEKEVHIVHVGRMIELKNHHLMIDCIEQLNQISDKTFYLHCFGTGKLLDEIKMHIDASKMNEYVVLEGISNSITKILGGYDIFILPSQQEGMPVSVIEAMGVGMPIIASNVGGIPDVIIHKKNGYLIEPTLKALSAAILNLSNSKEDRERIGKTAIIDSRNYSSKKMTENYIDVYKERKRY